MRQWYIVLLSLVFAVVTAFGQTTVPTTAKELVQKATDNAKSSFNSDAYLVNVLFGKISVQGLDFEMDMSTGKATGWLYRFYSPSLDSTYSLAGVKTILGDLIIPPPGGAVPSLPFERDAELTDPWIDSPMALDGAKSGGASDFIANNPGIEIITAAALYNPFATSIAPEGKFWVMQFAVPGDTLTCGVYAENGTPYQCGTLVSVKGIPDAQRFRLDQNYPNPVSLSRGNSTIITFGLTASTHIRLMLHDALGRTVETLYDGFRNAGEYRTEVHSVAFASPGLYFYRLETPSGVQTRRIVVVQ